ncbi:MAG TPA: hypothetical protein VGD24_02520 [Gallionella sp.]
MSLDTLERVGLTAAFGFFIYLIWSSSTDIETQLGAKADEFAVVHNLQVDYKNEIQEWKNLLLRSDNREILEKNWQLFERQHQKVADAARLGMQRSDVRAVNVKLQAFIEAHEANFQLYKQGREVLAKQNFDPRQADAVVKGIDRPLLDILEAGDEEMQAEKKRIDERIIAKANNRIELGLVALFLLMLIAIWRPRH